MSQLFQFPSAVRRDPAIALWMREHSGELGTIAERWFAVMRNCGDGNLIEAAYAEMKERLKGE